MTNSTPFSYLRTNDKRLRATQGPNWLKLLGLNFTRALSALCHRQVSVVVKRADARSTWSTQLELKRCSDPEYSRLKLVQENFTNQIIWEPAIGFRDGGLR